LIKKKLKPFQKLSPKGGRLEWLEGISCFEAKQLIDEVIETSNLEYEKYPAASYLVRFRGRSSK
jgi:hypothetical protein